MHATAQTTPLCTPASTPPPATLPAAPAARLDLYSQVHKGLRAFLCATLVEWGRLDSACDQEAKSALDQLDALLDFCAGHIEKEDRYVHPAMEARSPLSTRQVAHEHEEHAQAIQRLRTAAHDVACTRGLAREKAASALYGALAVFVAENLAHMQVEESQHNAVLWAHYSDEELAEIYGAIMAATSPADMDLSARWLVPNLTPAERTALIGGLRASMPGEVFAAILALIRPHLPRQEWRRLCAALDLPALPARELPAAAQLVQRFTDAVFVHFDAGAAAALVSADFVAHPWAALGVPRGPAGIGPVVSAFHCAFEGTRVMLDDVLVDEDLVALRYRYSGRHAGALFGIPATGKKFEMAGILIVRLQEGKVAEFWREEDMLGLQQQLGLSSLLPAG
ncbi:MAG TPA: ester cyclase [Burkholderiaceae bacterium]|nr:ester cyclase [Burkholderiaceae bacterium]